MLHLRIITPPELTAAVLRELADDPGVTHVTADRGAATEPPGDLVSCDVVRASVNPLIRRLRSAGVAERGGIAMTELEAVVSTAADRAQAEILTPEIDTVVWEVSARSGDRGGHQQPGADRGGDDRLPDYGPMAALSVAAVNRAYGQAWQSFRALAVGFPMAALAAGAVVGVLVSITTIPVASNVGVAVAMGNLSRRASPCRSCSSTW